MQHTLLATLLSLLGLAATATSAAAQETQPPGDDASPQDFFFDTTHVNVVNAEVYVTDRKGNRVTGLTRDDFEIYESGERMEITNFFAVEDGRPVRTPGEPRVGEAPDDPLLADLALPTLREDQRLHLVVYVDNFNLRPTSRNRVMRRMRRFLREKITPQDRVMVVSYDRSLHVRQPFTADINLISEALLEVEELTGNRVNRDAERREALEQITEESRDSTDALQQAQSFADLVYTEMDFTLTALENQVDTLSGVVGRKAILYVSDGIPLVPAEDLFIAVEQKYNRSSARVHAFSYSYANRYRDIVHRANASGMTFYTLDAGGLKAHETIGADFAGTSDGGMAFVDSVRSSNLQAPLTILAEDTGGKSIINTNAVEAGLGKIAEDFRNYYSLGYQPPHNGSGRYYKIEVKVKRKGLEVRHRNGYRDKTPEARLTDGTVSALYYGFEFNPLTADVEFGATTRGSDRHFLLPVTVQIPLGKLTLAEQQSHYIGRFRLSVVVMDENGRVSPVQQPDPVTVSIPRAAIEQARGQHFAYEIGLNVRKGLVRVALGIRDELSTETSFLRRTVRIADS